MAAATQSARRFFLLLLAATTVLVAVVVRPLATPLFLATVSAVVLWPVHARLRSKLGRPKVAASLVVLGVLLLLVVPAAAFSAFLVREGRAGLEFVSTLARSERIASLVEKLPQPLETWVTDALARVPHAGDGAEPRAEPQEEERDPAAAPSGGGQAVAAVGVAAKATGAFLFGTTMMIIALYFLLVHGDELVAWLDGLLPLPKGQTLELLTEFKDVSRAVALSTLVTAAIQAVAALIGYLITGIPHPWFFCALTFFLALVPVIGAAAVCVVGALVLYATDHPYMAVFLALWGILVVGVVDNLVKPLLAKRGMRTSGAIVFFALIGGLRAFGPKGLLIGPLVVALFLAMLRIHQRERSRLAP